MMPRRTEVWIRKVDVDQGPERVVIISCDDWNSRSGTDLLCIPIKPLMRGPLTPAFDVAFSQDNREWVIRTGIPFGLRRDELVELDESIYLDAAIVEAVNIGLSQIIDLMAHGHTYNLPPAQRQTRFAELHIEGQGSKPVVIVSGSGYADRFNFELVVGVRMSSKKSTGYRFDVEIKGREAHGKVVCSDVYTIPRRDLRLRQRPPDPPALSASQWGMVRERLFEFMGLL